MRSRHGVPRPEMTWLEMDVLHLDFEDGLFDLVVDKGLSRPPARTATFASGRLMRDRDDGVSEWRPASTCG